VIERVFEQRIMQKVNTDTMQFGFTPGTTDPSSPYCRHKWNTGAKKSSALLL